MEKIKDAIDQIDSALQTIKELENEERERLQNVTDDSYPDEDLIRIVIDDLRECKEMANKILTILNCYETGFYD